jgi:hypothetical protein
MSQSHTDCFEVSPTSTQKRIQQNSEATHAVLTAVTMKNAVLQDVTPCRLVERHSCTLNGKACRHIAADTDSCSGPKPPAEHQALCRLIGFAWNRQHGSDNVTFQMFLWCTVSWRTADSVSGTILCTDGGTDCELWWVVPLAISVTWLPAARVALTLETMTTIWGRYYFYT